MSKIEDEKIDKARDELENICGKHILTNVEMLSMISSWLLELLVYSPLDENSVDNILNTIKSEFIESRKILIKQKKDVKVKKNKKNQQG